MRVGRVKNPKVIWAVVIVGLAVTAVGLCAPRLFVWGVGLASPLEANTRKDLSGDDSDTILVPITQERIPLSEQDSEDLLSANEQGSSGGGVLAEGDVDAMNSSLDQRIAVYRGLLPGLRAVISRMHSGNANDFVLKHSQPFPIEELKIPDVRLPLSEFDLASLDDIAASYLPLLDVLSKESLAEINESFARQLSRGEFRLVKTGDDPPPVRETFGEFVMHSTSGVGVGFSLQATYDSADHAHASELLEQIKKIQIEIQRLQKAYLGY